MGDQFFLGYQNLSNKTIGDFGVTLRDRAMDQVVSIDTNIGNQPIIRILSEGEQKIHALALYFAELSVSNCQIIIFDDPVNSFDYNYSNKFSERLRDYILQNPNKQLIVLTHNWDFFVYLQLIFNKAHLNNDVSVQVIEQCSIVAAYSEDVERIKNNLEQKLNETGFLSLEDKEYLSANLRRLIEFIVNKYVFNGQRHQYKQKTISVSTFDLFTKLVPLTANEARQFRDLYSNLSVPEHYDPRNHYRYIDRSTFNSWYNDICNIENNLISRRSQYQQQT